MNNDDGHTTASGVNLGDLIHLSMLMVVLLNNLVDLEGWTSTGVILLENLQVIKFREKFPYNYRYSCLQQGANIKGTYWTTLGDTGHEIVSPSRKVTQLVNDSNASTEFGKLAIVMYHISTQTLAKKKQYKFLES